MSFKRENKQSYQLQLSIVNTPSIFNTQYRVLVYIEVLVNCSSITNH